jgi:hypothetical protein
MTFSGVVKMLDRSECAIKEISEVIVFKICTAQPGLYVISIHDDEHYAYLATRKDTIESITNGLRLSQTYSKWGVRWLRCRSFLNRIFG